MFFNQISRLPGASGSPYRLETAALAFCLAFSLAHAVSAHEFKLGDIEVKHPWSRATPPGARVAGGYLEVVNAGPTPDKILSATAEIAGRTEIHEMSVKDGIMSMRPLPDGVVVPAAGAVALKPGGYHFMFLELKRQPKEGESFAGTVTFEHAGTMPVSFKVEPVAGPRKAQDSGADPHAAH